MATQVAHPRTVKKCVFCKRWSGDANMIFKSPQSGFQFDLGVYGRCMANNSNQPSSGSCSNYEPSAEASRIL